MTGLTGPLVLPASLRLVPVFELAPETRERLGGEPGDVALTDPGSRTPSRLVDAETAALLERFRSATTIAEAVLAFSRERGLDPGPILEAAYPQLRRLADDGFLVAAGGPEARGTAGTLRRGGRFAGYEILEPCQATEDSEVVQARGPQGVVCLKVERPRSASSATQSLDFEAAVLERLAGSVAPRLLDRGGEPVGEGLAGRRWLGLEWLPGLDAGRVAREIRSSAETDPAARRAALHRLAGSLLSAYVRLHEAGVVHGDVHPGNVLVPTDGGVRLLDFGVAAFHPDCPGHAGLTSPPRGGIGFYYEPECALSMLDVGRAVPPSLAGEQYSLAALLYFLLTGAHYRDFPLTRDGMLREIATSSPRPFAELGLEPWPEAEAVLARALEKAPEERFPSVADFASAWTGIESTMRAERRTVNPGDPVEAGTSPRSERARGSRLSALTDQALSRLDTGGEAFVSESPAPPTASVFFGALGSALALLHMAKAREDGDLLALAGHWLARAKRRAQRAGAWEAEERGITADLIADASPYHGACGVEVAAAHLARALGEPEMEAAALGRFARLVAASEWKSLDLTLGAAGSLLAASDLLPGAPAAARPGLEAVGRDLFAKIWGDLVARPAAGEDSGLRGFGVAHGWAGRLYALLRWCRAVGEGLPAGFEERLLQLAALAEPWGRGLRWRCLAEDGGDLGALSGWCNGSAGFVFLWDEALRHLPGSRFEDLREGAAWHAWEGPDEGPDLCCGIAGRSYALLSLFRGTGEGAWLARAEALAERAAGSTLRQGTARERAPDALFKGALGVAVLGVDLERPETAAFPCFEEAR